MSSKQSNYLVAHQKLIIKKKYFFLGLRSDANLTARDITCLGISTQRSTFITWDRETGETFHNFITWKDLRADAMVRKWNSSLTLKVAVYNFLLPMSN